MNNDDAEVWDQYVAIALKKPTVYHSPEHKQQFLEDRRQEALQLAAAALRAAGEHTLAENILLT